MYLQNLKYLIIFAPDFLAHGGDASGVPSSLQFGSSEHIGTVEEGRQGTKQDYHNCFGGGRRLLGLTLTWDPSLLWAGCCLNNQPVILRATSQRPVTHSSVFLLLKLTCKYSTWVKILNNLAIKRHIYATFGPISKLVERIKTLHMDWYNSFEVHLWPKVHIELVFHKFWTTKVSHICKNGKFLILYI